MVLGGPGFLEEPDEEALKWVAPRLDFSHTHNYSCSRPPDSGDDGQRGPPCDIVTMDYGEIH